MLARLLLPLCLLGPLAIPCLAQSDNGAAPAANPPAPSTSPTANSAPPAPKKVWTNDDLPTAKSSADKRNQNARPASGQTADPATIERIRKNLEKLQSQLDDVNKKLKSLKDFMEGESVSTGSRDLDKGLNRVPVDQQVVQLQEKKKTLEAELSDLWDEARKKGIDPGQLR